MYIRFLFNIGECIYLVSFGGNKKYVPYFILRHAYIMGQVTHTIKPPKFLPSFRLEDPEGEEYLDFTAGRLCCLRAYRAYRAYRVKGLRA